MSSPSRWCTFAVAVWAVAVTARGQELAIARVAIDAPLAVTAADGAAVQASRLPAGANVTAGFGLTAAVPGANANASGQFVPGYQRLDASVSACCSRGGQASLRGSASAGRPTVTLHLAVPRPMAVRIRASVGVAVLGGAQPVRGVVDLGADGSAELDFASRSVCDLVERDVVLDLPAGVFPIRLQAESDLPVDPRGGTWSLANATARVQVEPCHAVVAFEGPSCGASVGAVPLLDGRSVSFSVGLPHSSYVGWLVLGSQPAAVGLPFAPGCPLLVQPDVVLAASQATALTLPLAHLGPIELFAQGVVWQPSQPWQPTAQLRSSQRLRIQVR